MMEWRGRTMTGYLEQRPEDDGTYLLTDRPTVALASRSRVSVFLKRISSWSFLFFLSC